jgi:hypothetical protein
MRVTAIYKTSPTLTITAGGGNMFENAQATIDSTGKAQAILRRILVAVDLTDANTYAIPSGALITEDSVCKQFGVTPNYFSVNNSGITGGGGNDQLCTPINYGTPSP